MEPEEQARKETLPADPSAPSPADEILRALVGAVTGSETRFPMHRRGGEDSEVASVEIDFHLSASRPGLGIPVSHVREETLDFSPKQKQRCPYCGTEFSRHHNLKSRLLTHSQELSYISSTGQTRFRRLPDLDHHTKCYTGAGEGPYTCGTCGREFAHRDAIAQPKLGAAGCHTYVDCLGSACRHDIKVEPEANDDIVEPDGYGDAAKRLPILPMSEMPTPGL